MNDEKCVESGSASSQTSQQSHQNIPQGHHNSHQGRNNIHQGHHSSQQESFPNQIIPVQDILPLTLAGKI